jgi:hypothetical protein
MRLLLMTFVALRAMPLSAEYPVVVPAERVDVSWVIIVGTLGELNPSQDGWYEGPLKVEEVLWGKELEDLVRMRVPDPAGWECPPVADPTTYVERKAMWFLQDPGDHPLALGFHDEFLDLKDLGRVLTFLRELTERRGDLDAISSEQLEKRRSVIRYLTPIRRSVEERESCPPDMERGPEGSPKEILEKVLQQKDAKP